MKKLSFQVFMLSMALCLARCANNLPESVPEIDTGIDPTTWTMVPTGEFLMGLHAHQTDVDYDYEIMLVDVTNEQFAHFLNTARVDGAIGFEGAIPIGYYPGDKYRGHEHEEEITEGMYPLASLEDPGTKIELQGNNYFAEPGFDNHPVTLVSWFGARAYCNYYGWRLPTEIEWEKAARGVDGRPFPWGDGIQRQNANYYSSHDIFEKTFSGAGGTTPVGFYNGEIYSGFQTLDSPSPYGLYDMAGNVWQWTGDVYTDQHYRYMRGGSYQNYAYNLRVWTRNSAGPTYTSPSVGFRCARDS